MTAPNNTTPPEAPDPGTGTQGEPTPGSSADDRDAQVAALNAEAARWRRQLRDKEQEIERLKLASASDSERAIAQARIEGATEYQRKWQRAVVENTALSVLAERGCPAAEPALKALDLDDVDVDPQTGRFDRNQIVGKVDDLMRRYPVFASSSGAPPLPTLFGDSQHRVTTDQQIRPSGKLTDKQTEDLLRYGLGR
jgi:hypothetical protein